MRPSIAILFYLLALKNNKLPKINLLEMEFQVKKKIECSEGSFGDTPNQAL